MSYWWTASVVVRNTGRGEGKRAKQLSDLCKS
jgi:hypothetical protein